MIVLSFMVELSLPCFRKKITGKGTGSYGACTRRAKTLQRIPSMFLGLTHWSELFYMQHLIVRKDVKCSGYFFLKLGIPLCESKLKAWLRRKQKRMVIRQALTVSASLTTKIRIQNIWQRLAYSSLRSQLKCHSRNSIYLEKLITISFTGTFIEYILHIILHIIFKMLSHLIHSNLPRQVFLLTCIYKEAQMRMNNCQRTQNQKIAKTGFKDPVSNLGYCEQNLCASYYIILL